MEPESSIVLQSEHLFRTLFANHAAVSLLIDAASGRIMDANEAAAAYYGWTRDTLRQMRIQQINTLPPEALHQAMAQAASSRQYHFEFRHRRADNSIRDVEVYANRIEIDGKSLLFSIVHDVTNRKQAEEELRRQATTLAAAKAKVEQEQRLLSAVLDALPTGVAITNRQGGTLLTNAAYEHIWGGPLPETASVADYAAYKAWWDATGEPVAPEEWASAIATRTGQTAVGQVMRLQRFDGSEVYVINSAAPVFDHQGQLAGCAVAIQDITALMCAEHALRDKTEDFNRAQEVGRIGSWRLDIRRNVLSWSDENYRIFGIPKGTPLRHETFLASVHPDDRAFVDADWRHAMQRGTPYVTEHRIIADGQVKWVREKAYLEFDDNEKLIAGFGITQDITERKLAEEALGQSEERYRLLAETMLHGVMHHDAEGRIIAVNRAAEMILGRPRQELLRCTSVEAVPNLVRENGEPLPAGERPEMVALESGRAVRGVVVGVFNPQSGARRWMRIDAVPVLAQGGARPAEVFTVFEDITERKLARETLREQERTLRALINAADESIWLVRLDGEVLAVNDTAARRLGRTPEEVIGSRWQTLLPADLAASRTEKANEILRTGRPVSWEDRREDMFFEHFAYPVRDDQGMIAAIALFSRDVSERKAAEEALRQSDAQRRAAERRLLENEARFRLALDAASNGVWDCNLETGEVYRGENWHCTLGYDRALPAAEEDLFASLVHPDDLARERAERRAHLQGRTDRYEVEYRLRTQAGEWRWMLSRGRVVERDAHGRALRFTGTITDITRLKKAEAALQRSHAELEERVRERTVELSESNVALTVLLKKREQDRAALAEQVLATAGNLLEPFLDRLQDCRLNEQQRVLVDILRANLKELTAPFASAFASKMARLTPAEMQVANLIKLGKRSKEIADILHLSPGTVNVHRKNIRKKLDIDHQKANLQTLLTMQD